MKFVYKWFARYLTKVQWLMKLAVSSAIFSLQIDFSCVELEWCSGSVMDCHSTAQGSIPSENVLHQSSTSFARTVNGNAFSE